MENLLSPGQGGLVAPSPEDEKANTAGGAPTPANSLALPGPQASAGPSEMQQHFMTQEDAAAAKFKKVKAAEGLLSATREEVNKLLALGDTVSMDDVIEGAAGMVAAGVPAARVAGMLAEMPEGKGQLQGWVQEQSAKLQPLEAQLAQGLQKTSYDLGLAATKSLITHSAESHFEKKLTATASGRTH